MYSMKCCMYACLAGWALSGLMLLRLPPSENIHKELYNQPTRNFLQEKNFNYLYHGQTISVMPLASYSIDALVVSHNDPALWYVFDLSHDNQSINTRDLCLMWGKNLVRGDYKAVAVHNDDSACSFIPSATAPLFNNDEVLNHQLITNSDAIRDRIRSIHTGDQIHLKGKLVVYSEERWRGRFQDPDQLRASNGGAKNVIVFVEALTVLESYNHYWAKLNVILLVLFFALMLARILEWLFTREY